MACYRLLLPLAAALLVVTAETDGPLTAHFSAWLKSHGLSGDDFERVAYGTKGSYGGKQNDADTVKKTPVIFVHGNSDSALHSSLTATGWDNSIEYFLQNGYSQAEIYATSWGDTNALNAPTRTHDCETVGRIRRFIEAVKNYTRAPAVSLISHSMGVTLARKAIKGGPITGASGKCNIGYPLKYVDAFLGLAGGNYGLCSCEGLATTVEATCNMDNGFWPGDTCGFNYLTCGLAPLPFPCNGAAYSTFLTKLNEDPTPEAKHVFSAWSAADDLILYGDNVWGRPTSLIPRSSGEKTYASYTHMQTKENTAGDQFSWMTSYNA